MIPEDQIRFLQLKPATASIAPAARLCYVASLDLLGFKNALENYGAQAMAAIYAEAISLASRTQHATKETAVAYVENGYLEDEGRPGSADMFAYRKVIPDLRQPAYPGITNAIFSDSLFFFTTNQTPSSLRTIIDLSNAVFQVFLSHKLPMRGAISKGECIVWPEKTIYVGSGIVKAFTLQESLNIVGVVCDGDIESSEKQSEPIPIALRPICEHMEPNTKYLRAPRPLPQIREQMWQTKPDFNQLYKDLRQEAVGRASEKYRNGISVVESMLGITLEEEASFSPSA